MSDTRKDERTDLSLKVRFKSASVDEFVEQYSGDISRGGLFIKSKQPMAVGTLLKFEFQLKDQSRLIHGVGRVAWIRSEAAASEDAPPGMGIKFVKMDAESRELVNVIVERRGEQPGRFDDGDSPQAPVTSAPFFPEGPPAELPRHEDRTNVRHAADFLASALAAGNADKTAAEEAAASAEAALRRGLEIQARRDAEAKAGLGVDVAGVPRAERFEEEDAATIVEDRSKVASELAAMLSSKNPPPEPAMRPGATEGLVVAMDSPAARGPGTHDPRVARDQPSARAPIPAPPTRESRAGILSAALAVAVLAACAVWYFGFRTSPTPPPTVPARVEPAATTPAPVAPPEVPPPVPAVVVDAAVAPDAEPVAQAPVPTRSVMFTTLPPGAVVRFDGMERGVAPVAVALPIGREVVVTIKAPGFAEVSRTLNVTETTPPQRITLTRLPFVLTVTTNAPNPSIGALRRVAGANGEIVVPNVPVQFPLAVTAAGFVRATRDVLRSDFVEENGAMRLTLQVPLTAREVVVRPVPAVPTPNPGGVRQPGPAPITTPVPDPSGLQAPPAPVPAPEPAPVPAPVPAPAPAPEPAPAPASAPTTAG